MKEHKEQKSYYIREYTLRGVTIHAHQLKNGNKMDFRSNKLKNS